MENGKNITKRANGRPRVQTYFDLDVDPSLTRQEFQEECDVNTFIAKQKALNPTAFSQWFKSAPQGGVYADFTELPNYQEMLNTIIKAEADFEQLPSGLRQRFQNNPQMLIDYLNDPQNEEESIKLGLRVRPTPPPPNPIQETLNQISKNTSPKKPKSNPDED